MNTVDGYVWELRFQQFDQPWHQRAIKEKDLEVCFRMPDDWRRLARLTLGVTLEFSMHLLVVISAVTLHT